MSRFGILLCAVAGALAVATFLMLSDAKAPVMTLENGLGDEVLTSSL